MTASAKGTAEEPGKNVRQKAGLNRSILNSGWGKIRSYTQYKGLRKNKLTITIPAHYSSQECSRCGFTHKDNRPSQAEFICQACGFMCNADFNASFVIKKRGVRAVLNNEVRIKIPKKVAFSKKLARRAGTVRTDASASTPVERVSVISASKPICNSRLKQEPPLELR
jgi:putative transposase